MFRCIVIFALYLDVSEPFVTSISKFGKITSHMNVMSTNEPSNNSPRRVTNAINIPVRQQIAWAKAYKRFLASQKSGQPETRKFRKQKAAKVAEEDYIEIDYVNTKPPAVFVDGYNIIGHINRVENRKIAFEDARNLLISDLSVLRSATGWWIEVVFDAYKSGLGGGSTSVDNIHITYTSAAETADNYIERRFNELRQEGYTNMVVATDDSALRMVAGSLGVGYLPAGSIVEEFRIAYRGWESVEEELQFEEKRLRPRIGDGISEEVRDAIEQLKQQKQQQLQREKVMTTQAIPHSTATHKVHTASNNSIPKKPKGSSELLATRASPTIGDGLSEEVRAAIEAMRLSAAAAGTATPPQQATRVSTHRDQEGVERPHSLTALSPSSAPSQPPASLPANEGAAGAASSYPSPAPKKGREGRKRGGAGGGERNGFSVSLEYGKKSGTAIGDGLSEDVRRAIEQLRQQQ